MARHAERTLGRQLAFQFLFSHEFVDTPWQDALTEFWRIEPAELTENACEEDEVPAANRTVPRGANMARAKRHAEELIEGVCESKKALDAQIAAALDNWKPERVGRVEWVITRLALFELLHCPNTPNAVAVAEAVQLANIFGDAESPRFVNGLLDKLASAANPVRDDTDTDEKDAP